MTYFFWLGQSSGSLQQLVYGLGKFIQFTFPLWWVVWVLKSKFKLPFRVDKKAWVGIGFGLLAGVAIIYLPQLSAFETSLNTVQINIQNKIDGFGLHTSTAFILLGLFYSLIHSFLEEYYWRGFVYVQLQKYMKISQANLLSSLAFMAHHIVVMAVLLRWDNPLTYLIAGCIGLMGSFWAWHFTESKSLFGPWISHMIEDAAIFYLGYQLIQF